MMRARACGFGGPGPYLGGHHDAHPLPCLARPARRPADALCEGRPNRQRGERLLLGGGGGDDHFEVLGLDAHLGVTTRWVTG